MALYLRGATTAQNLSIDKSIRCASDAPTRVVPREYVTCNGSAILLSTAIFKSKYALSGDKTTPTSKSATAIDCRMKFEGDERKFFSGSLHTAKTTNAFPKVIRGDIAHKMIPCIQAKRTTRFR